MTEHYQLIQNNTQLSIALNRLSSAQFIALDTEFVRRNTYKPILCLIQIMSDRGDIFLLDALSLDLAPFWQWLQTSTAVKVFHDSRQDLEIVWLESGNLPSPIFDTQLAALMLGLGESCGFARLVESELGVVLSKDQTETDWSQRPLSVAQLNYAVDDVLYLAKLYPKLQQKLIDNGRLHWIDEDNQQLSEVTLYQADIISLRKKVKAPPFFNAKQKHQLDVLLLWRETKAIEYNKPRQWILDNRTLISLAGKSPKTIEQLSRYIDNPATIRKYATELITLLQQPYQPVAPMVSQPTHACDQQLNQLLDKVNEIATAFGLRQASTWLNKQELNDWLTQQQWPLRARIGWRRQLIETHQLQDFVTQLANESHQQSEHLL